MTIAVPKVELIKRRLSKHDLKNLLRTIHMLRGTGFTLLQIIIYYISTTSDKNLYMTNVTSKKILLMSLINLTKVLKGI